MRSLLFLLGIVMSVVLHAQTPIVSELLAGPEWFEGSLMLSNGKTMTGLIKYNDKTDIVCIENAKESKAFTARQVTSFRFLDEVEGKQRAFFSVEVKDQINDIKRPLFFELLVDSKDFALISKIAPIKIDRKEYATPAMFNPATGSFSSGRYYGYPTTISQTETLFILTRNNGIKPLLQIKEKDIDGMFRDRTITKRKLIDESALKEHTSPYYKQLLSYAEKNELNLRKKEDLISLIQYFNSLQQSSKLDANILNVTKEF